MVKLTRKAFMKDCIYPIIEVLKKGNQGIYLFAK